MRFRARAEPGPLQTLVGRWSAAATMAAATACANPAARAAIAQCLDKISTECVLNLTEKNFEFRKRPVAECEVEVYASLASDVFADYRIESKAGNVISLEVNLKNLLRALRSAGEVDETVIKLTRKGNMPCLTIIADTPSGLNVTQDVPILRLITQEGMKDYAEPNLGRPCVTGSFPEPRHVRTVLERMKQLDKYVTIEFNQRKGALVFKVQTEVVSLRTFYTGIEINFDGKLRRRGTKFSAMVNIGELLSVMHFANANYEKVVVCCIEDSALVIYVGFEEGSGAMTYYCPLIDPNDIEMDICNA